jgi:predicted nucleic acid-binding protein
MNVVSVYLSKGLLPLNKASEAVELAEIQMKNRDYRPVAFDVLEKSMQSGLNVRDCEFVSLASFTGIRLVTLDERIIKRFPEVGIHPDEFSPVPG